MKDTDRQRIERALEEFDAWRASGMALKAYVQLRGEELAHWRARLRWGRRWRKMLNGTYTKDSKQINQQGGELQLRPRARFQTSAGLSPKRGSFSNGGPSIP